jgi:predicted ribosome-associated RNA-binding protein Tma20
MFKKDRDLDERSKTLLKNKEIRTLKSEICKQFPAIREEELSTFIPNKAGVTITKLANKTYLYSIDGIIIVFDVGGRSKLLPALPLLWRFPNALPTFVTHGPVSEFVLRGADLMIPGLCGSKIGDLVSSGLKEGDAACVRIAGNPMPFAVGRAAVSAEALATGARRKGVALEVVHVYGDLLLPPRLVVAPNSGFGSTRIYALAADEEGGATVNATEEAEAEALLYEEDDEDLHENDDASSDGANNAGTNGNDAECNGGVHDDSSGGRAGDNTDRGEEKDFKKEGDDDDCDTNPSLNAAATTTTTTTTTSNNTNNDTDSALPTKQELEQQRDQCDAALLQAVLLCSKYVIKDKQLPMLVSTYWAILQRSGLYKLFLLLFMLLFMLLLWHKILFLSVIRFLTVAVVTRLVHVLLSLCFSLFFVAHLDVWWRVLRGWTSRTPGIRRCLRC